MAPLWQTGLQTDFYLFVVAAVYHADGLWGHATFDLYPRAELKGSSFLVAAGMHEALAALQEMHFPEPAIDWMREQPGFAKAGEGWWDSLRNFQFTGSIHCVPEGSLVFPGEPIMRITAPLQQATLVQTRLLQLIPAATAVATRAARSKLASGGRRLYEFASRRSPSGESAALTARAAMVGGFFATSNAAAAAELDVPVMGTLSADYYTAYGGVESALQAFAVHFSNIGFINLPPGHVDQAVASLAPFHEHIRVLRVDHRQLARAARTLRPKLDAAGLGHVKILGSGSLDERRIAALGDAPVDLLAVGKSLVAGGPVPTSYRISEMWRGPDAEPSLLAGSSRWPGSKQILRREDHDLICLVDEADGLAGRPMLVPMMIDGEPVGPVPSVMVGQERCLRELAAMPEELLEYGGDWKWEVRVSDGVKRLMEKG